MVDGGAYPFGTGIAVCVLLAFAVALGFFAFRSRRDRSPQARLDAKLGVRHSCSDGRKGVWQYLGPQETLANWSGALWRRFRVCPTCGECEYWPENTLDPGDAHYWPMWQPLLFNDMLAWIKIREEHVAKVRKKEEAEQRVRDEKRTQHEKELAEAARKQRESSERAREFVTAKIHLLSEKVPDDVVA